MPLLAWRVVGTEPSAGEPAGGPGRVTLVAPAASRGIRRHAEGLAASLRELGVAADVAEKATAGVPAHFHLANSTRRLLPELWHRTGDLVTVHDVVPRNGLLRRLLPPLLRRALAGHRLVVHSRYAAGMLERTVRLPALAVVPLSFPIDRPDPAALTELRGQLRSDGDQLIAVVAGLLRRTKGVGELLEAVSGHPRIRLVLAGRIHDRDTRAALSDPPANVRVVESPDHETFDRIIAAADVLVALRRDSVGETSGPVVQAHLLGTPVAGLRLGSLPEYCGASDVLLDPRATADDLFTAITAAPLPRVPATDPRAPTMSEVARRYAEIYRQLPRP
jgi:glycosyltransferase involved in cell wall biosynthesis